MIDSILFPPPLLQSRFSPVTPPKLLAAPRIAGLLPAPVPQPVKTFYVIENARFADLTAEERDRLCYGIDTLVTVALLVMTDQLNELALNAALALFRKSVAGPDKGPMNPARHAATLNVPILELLLERYYPQTGAYAGKGGAQ